MATRGRPNPKARRHAGNEGKVRGPSRAAFRGPPREPPRPGHVEHPCAEVGCTARGIVGLGSTPEWLCVEHFGARLSGIRQTISAAMNGGRP